MLITVLIIVATCLGLLLALYNKGEATGKDKVNLQNAIKSNEVKDEIIEFKRREKNFIHSVRINTSLLDRVRTAKQNKSDT